MSVIFDALQKLDQDRTGQGMPRVSYIEGTDGEPAQQLKFFYPFLWSLLLLVLCAVLWYGIRVDVSQQQSLVTLPAEMITPQAKVEALEEVQPQPNLEHHVTKLTENAKNVVSSGATGVIAGQARLKSRVFNALRETKESQHIQVKDVNISRVHKKAEAKLLASQRLKIKVEPKIDGFKMQQELARLVPQLVRAINMKDNALADDLLHRLESMKDVDSLFVLKMKAYRALRSEKYEQASYYYQRLLSRQPDDIESHMNFVMAEVYMQHVDQAKEHVNALLQRYPNDVRVKAMKLKMMGI